MYNWKTASLKLLAVSKAVFPPSPTYKHHKQQSCCASAQHVLFFNMKDLDGEHRRLAAHGAEHGLLVEHLARAPTRVALRARARVPHGAQRHLGQVCRVPSALPNGPRRLCSGCECIASDDAARLAQIMRDLCDRRHLRDRSAKCNEGGRDTALRAAAAFALQRACVHRPCCAWT